MRFTIILLSIILVTLHSCVPQRKLEEEKARRESAEKELSSLKTSSQECETRSKEMKTELEENEVMVKKLKKDTAYMRETHRELSNKYNKLNELNERLLEKYNKLLDGSISDSKKLSGELQTTQEELLKKQDELKLLEKDLNKKEKNLELLTGELKQRESRVNELEGILKRKDEAVNELKQKVSNALLGFENKGLTITQRNGKVYVSLDESLLFASGSTVVESKGADALKKLAKALESNQDINIMVEGHTDDVPMNGKGDIKDNWDLSVMRATSIVKIITNNSNVNPKRIVAAGRSEYLPIDSSKSSEARKKNRRTEIILTPKLDELLKVLENN